MALGRFFKRLLGSESPSEWAGASERDLERLWQARGSLSAPMVLQLRDEHVRRHLGFPLADPTSPMAPRTPGLDQALRREGLISYLRRLDAYDREPEAFEAFDRGAFFACGEDSFLAVVLPAWGPAAPLPEAEGVETVIIAEPDHAGAPAAADAARAFGVTPEAIHALRAGDERPVGRLSLRAAPGVIEVVDDEADLRLLIGPAVPLRLLVRALDGGEAPLPDAIIGGVATDVSDEDREVLESAGLEPADLVHFDRFVLLPAVAGTPGLLGPALIEPLTLPCGAIGRGVPVGAEAQALLTGQADDPPALAAREAFTRLVVEGALDEAAAIADRAPEEARAWLRGALAELRGDEADWSGDEPMAVESRAVQQARAGDPAGAWQALQALEATAHPFSAANRVLVAARAGERDAALALLMEEQTGSNPWAHALLDAALHDGERRIPEPFAPAGVRLAPIGSALLYLRAGQLEEGERLLRRCLELEPRHPAALGELARHLLRTGRTGEARALCDRALDALPAFAHLRVLRALALLAEGAAAEAAADLALAAAQVPDALDWRLTHLEALARAGRAEEALAEVEEIRTLSDGKLVDLTRRTLESRR